MIDIEITSTLLGHSVEKPGNVTPRFDGLDEDRLVSGLLHVASGIGYGFGR